MFLSIVGIMLHIVGKKLIVFFLPQNFDGVEVATM